jgi:hypothetical protein
MRILIEEYQYKYEDVSHVLNGLGILHDVEGKVSLSYVGYFYSPEIQDTIFILPKVLLEGKFGEEKVFGHIAPKELINPDECEGLTGDERKFIYKLSVWIYRAICVFKEHEYDRTKGVKKKPSIVLHKQAPYIGHSKRIKATTFLDVLLALQQWNKNNQQYVTFIVKNLHAGFNKINWTRTITRSQSFISEDENGNQSVAYLNPVNKKRCINFDEELLVIFYSILHYINKEYGLPVEINVNFDLIKDEKFKKYLNGYGKRRLKQIKYKYFSDKALELWGLCFDFFDQPIHARISADRKEYLLVKSFYVVFESIIDKLIAGDQKLPDGLIDQEDGKVVDHMYQYYELTNNDSGKEIYYIGDSKYYKRGRELSDESIYKQFTYARNVVQWNIDLFNDKTEEEQKGHIKLRDDVTEGYNIIPNFFISAQQNDLLMSDSIELTKDREQFHFSRQFENRLFDRSTFLLAHYDVNFLFVLALYGRDKESAQVEWRRSARKKFREQIQSLLNERFIFYAMTPHEDVDANLFVKENFQSLLGKVFRPFDDDLNQQYFSLALRNPEKIDITKKGGPELKAKLIDENDATLFLIKQAFYYERCDLGVDPRTKLQKVEPAQHKNIEKSLLTIHHIENYLDKWFVIGGFNAKKQMKWMFGREGGKRDDAYNVRIGKQVHGGIVKTRDEIKHAKFAILYEFGKEPDGVFKSFRVKNTGEMTKDQMIRTGYEDPRHDSYLCYFFDEEVSLGEFNIRAIIEADRKKFEEAKKDPSDEYPLGRPIYMKGEELQNYKL